MQILNKSKRKIDNLLPDSILSVSQEYGEKLLKLYPDELLKLEEPKKEEIIEKKPIKETTKKSKK